MPPVLTTFQWASPRIPALGLRSRVQAFRWTAESQIIDTTDADRNRATSDGSRVFIAYHDANNSTLIHVGRRERQLDRLKWTNGPAGCVTLLWREPSNLRRGVHVYRAAECSAGSRSACQGLSALCSGRPVLRTGLNSPSAPRGPLSWHTGKGLALGVGVLDVLLALLRGPLGLGVGVGSRLERVNGFAQAEILAASGCRTSGRRVFGFAGHVALQGVEIDPQVVRHVDRSDTLAEILEAVAGLLRCGASREQLLEIRR
jgi:hypothetical protein